MRVNDRSKVRILAALVGLCLVYIFGGSRMQWLAKSQFAHLDILKLCVNIDWSNPRYCAPVENDTVTFGKPFNLSSSLLKNLGIPLRDFVPIRRESLDDFVFATAASEDYFHFAMDAIGNIQKLLLNHTIYFYDLDLNISVEHIAKEMLSEFPRVFWIDTSIRFETNNLSLTLDEVFSSGGILTFIQSAHSNFEATHEGMYRFLPISAKAAANTRQYGSGCIYMHRTEEIYTRIIFWWVLCALTEECMAPTHELSCNFTGKDVWAGCHRFDQSSLNILMANHFLNNVSRYTSRHDQQYLSYRVAHQELLVVCPTEISVKSAVYFSNYSLIH